MNAYEKPARTFWGRVKFAFIHPIAWERAIRFKEYRKRRKFWNECESLARVTGRDYEKERKENEIKWALEPEHKPFKTFYNQG